MEQMDKQAKNKGGRPVKPVKKNRVLTLKCTNYERMIIQAKARKVNLSVSEYMRAMALNGKVDFAKKTLPKEVLELTGALNHMAAYLNQIAKKCNTVTENLTIMDFTVLKWQSDDLKEIAIIIKSYLS